MNKGNASLLNVPKCIRWRIAEGNKNRPAFFDYGRFQQFVTAPLGFRAFIIV